MTDAADKQQEQAIAALEISKDGQYANAVIKLYV
jgi:hypothetical protein